LGHTRIWSRTHLSDLVIPRTKLAAPLTIPREVVSKPAADRGSHPAFVIFICENLTILVMRRSRRSAGPRSGQPSSSLWRMGRRSACRLRKAYSSIQPLCTGQRFDRGKAPTAAIRQPHFMDLCRLISFATKPYQYAHVLSRAMRHSFKVRRVMDLVGRAISGCPRRPNRQSA
jgi:hypothetical protein